MKAGENWFTSPFHSLSFLYTLLFLPQNAESELSQPLFYPLQLLLGLLVTFQKEITMKTTQAPEIKLTPFLKMQGWGGGGERERKRERKREREREEKTPFSCIDVYKNHIVCQASKISC